MAKINQVNPATAEGKAKDLLAAVKAKMGLVPNMTRAMANSPAVLEGYLGFAGALSHGTLPPKTREAIALAVGETNGCEYCLGAHSAIAKMLGYTAEQVADARLGTASDPNLAVLLSFAQKIAETRGRVSDEDLATVREAGYSDAEITEIVANTALNIFTNYFNNAFHPDLDFPKAAVLAK